MKSYKTFVYPLDVFAIPIFFLSLFLFAIIAMAIDEVLDFFIAFLFSLLTLVPLAAIVLFERKIYEVVSIDSNGIHTRKTSFLWDDNCYKGVCNAWMGRIENPKCLYFSKEPIVDEARIMLKRNTKSTVIFPLNKKSKMALKKITPEIYKQFQYEIEH